MKNLNFNYLIVLLPPFLFTGPFLPDLLIVIFVLKKIFFNLKEKKFKEFSNKYFLFLFFFCCYIFFISFFSSNFFASFKTSVFYIRFPIFSLILSEILMDQNIRKLMIKSILISLVFVILDLFCQKIFGKNFFGIPPYMDHLGNIGRYGGIFGDEYILGSYITRSLILLVSLLLTIIVLDKKYLFYLLAFSVFSLSAILITTERTALALFLLFFSFWLFFIIGEKKKSIQLLIVFIFVTFTFISFDKVTRDRVFVEVKENILLSDRPVIFSPGHHEHIMTAKRIFIDNPLIGVGVKGYRETCKLQKYKVSKDSCTTHPHNYLAQFLAETGIIGLLIYLIGFFHLLKVLFSGVNFKNKNTALSTSTWGILVLMFPLLPSGNFFNNWLSAFLFTQIGIFLYIASVNKK